MGPLAAGRLIPAVLSVVTSLYFVAAPVGSPVLAANAQTLLAPAAPSPQLAWMPAAAVGAGPTGTPNQGSISAVVTP